MILWTTLGAAFAFLVWRLTSNPADAVTFGLTVFVAGLLVTSAVSNRVQRRLRALVARMVHRVDRREARLQLLAPLARIRSLAELFDRLPEATASAANVEPVTLFALDEEGNQFLPVSSTLLTVPCVPVAGDDPLVTAMRSSTRVHYLMGRTDDLENAPIHAVNRPQIEECQAVCSMPLRHEGALVGFLLCGGTEGRARLGLQSSGCLEELVRRYTSLVGRCAGADTTIEGRLTTSPLVAPRSVSA